MSGLQTPKPVIHWLPYQKKWLSDKSRFKIGMFTRRGGKTYGACGEIAEDCIDAEISGVKTRWTILSRSEATAKEAVEDALKPIVKGFWAAYNVIAKGAEPEYYEGEFYSQEMDATYKTHEVRFPGGSRVTALSASPDAARGFGGNLLLDEFGFHRDSRRIWGSAFPVVSRGGHKLRVISTPNGKGNKFYELMTTEDSMWSRHHVDIYEAVRQGLDVDIDEIKSGMADHDAWAQEFELQWMDEASSWLPYDLIASCENPLAGDPQRYRGGKCFVGVDIAARNDLFVIIVGEQVGLQLIVREVIVRKRITFAEQDRLLDDVVDRYDVVRIAIDQTGMGEKPVEDAQRRYGDSRVDGVLFTFTAKLDMATVLKEGMQDRTTLIPAGDPVFRADLHAIRSIVGPTGIRRLVAEGDTDGHADRFWALALMTSAAHPRDFGAGVLDMGASALEIDAMAAANDLAFINLVEAIRESQQFDEYNFPEGGFQVSVPAGRIYVTGQVRVDTPWTSVVGVDAMLTNLVNLGGGYCLHVGGDVAERNADGSLVDPALTDLFRACPFETSG